MKLYGYEIVDDVEDEAESPMDLKEVTFVADVATLRRLSEFFVHAANLIEKHGPDFGHEHFEDFDTAYRLGPRVVVSNPAQAGPVERVDLAPSA